MWDIAARRPVLVASFALIVTALSIVGAARLEPVTDFVDTVPDDEGVDAYREMVARLDGIRFIAVYMPKADEAASLRGDGFDALVAEQGELTQWLEQRHPGAFSHTLSAWEAMRSGNYMLEKVATAGNPRPESYSFPDDPVRYEAVKQQVLGDGTLDDVLAADGSSAILLLFLATDDNLEARRLSGQIAAELGEWDDHRVTGEPQASGLLVSSDYTDERNAADLRTFGLVALAGVAASLLWVVRRPSHVLLCMAGVAAATAWTFGLVGAFGARINFLTLFLAPVIIGIGVDASVHLLHRVDEEQTRTAAGKNAAATGARRSAPTAGVGKAHAVRPGQADDAARAQAAGGAGPPPLQARSQAVAGALRQSGPAVAVAGLTTAAGLAAVAAVPNPLFSQIAATAALGVALALVAAFTLVPALATIVPVRPLRAPRMALLPRLAQRLRRAPALAIVAVVLVSAAATTGLAQVRVESGSAENEFPQDDPLVVLQHRIEAEYGAFQRAYVIVRGDMTDPAALQALHAASRQAADLPLFRQASSVADVLLADEATDQGSADILTSTLLGTAGQAPAEEARLPQTRDEARQRLDGLFADPLWRTIAPFTIARDYDLAVVAVQLDPWADQAALLDLRDALFELEREVQASLPGHDVQAAGAPLNRAAVIEQTPVNVAVATIGVAATVGTVLAVSWRRRGLDGLRVAGLGMLIVLLAAAWLLASIPLLDAAYAWSGTANNAALTDMFLLAFAITVAVGIDDLVHLAARYWESRDAGRSTDEALHDAFTHAGRAVTGTTLTTFIAFALLSGVYFLQSKNLAILTAAGVVYAYVLTMLLAPWVLAGRRRPRSAKRTGRIEASHPSADAAQM